MIYHPNYLKFDLITDYHCHIKKSHTQPKNATYSSSPILLWYIYVFVYECYPDSWSYSRTIPTR